MDVVLYDGVSTVGGCKFMVRTRQTSIFLDFGRNYSRESSYFLEPIMSARDYKILIDLGIIPEVEGLYKGAEQRPSVDGIFISHAHSDHYGYIRYIKDDIPVYLGETALNLIMAREAASHPPRAEYAISRFTNGKVMPLKNFKGFRTGSQLKVGDLTVKPVHVDHSVPGSYGFIIDDGESTLVYTGDFRLHGAVSDLTLDFIREAARSKPDLMLVESTHITECKLGSEHEVRSKLGKIFESTKGLVAVGIGELDLDRLKSIFKSASKTGRELVIPLRTAFIINVVSSDPKLRMPHMEDVKVYVKEKRRYRQFEKFLLGELEDKGLEPVSTEYISKNQKSTVMVANYYHMEELARIKPMSGSVYILSSTEPFNEESEMRYERLQEWLRFLGLPMYLLHASGHADALDIRYLVESVKPRAVVPVHTEDGGVFRKFVNIEGIQVRCVKEGETISTLSM